MKSTDEMVGKCFYMHPRDSGGSQKYTVHFHTVTYKEGALALARSARRFVRMEQREKRKKVMATLKRERKSAVMVGELPENFGKMD